MKNIRKSHHINRNCCEKLNGNYKSEKYKLIKYATWT